MNSNIILTDKTLLQLLNWRDDNQDYVRDFHPTLTEGTIKLEVINIMFSANAGKLAIKLDSYKGKVVTFNYDYRPDKKDFLLMKTNITQEDLDEFLKDGDNETRKKEAEGIQGLPQELLTTVCSVLSYLLYYKKDIKVTERSYRKSKKVKGKYKYTEKNIVIKDYHISYINKKKITRSHYIRTIKAWGVRGHWRTYKNGKSIFIEPFVKGSNKEDIKNSNYLLKFKKDNKGV